MAKKPMAVPVAERPDYPSLTEVVERSRDRMDARAAGGYPCGIACPNCSEEIACVEPEIRPTSYDGIQHLKCTSCGWTGTMPTGAY